MRYPDVGAFEVRGEKLQAFIQRDELILNDLMVNGDLADWRVRNAIKQCKRRIARNTEELKKMYPQTKKATKKGGKKAA